VRPACERLDLDEDARREAHADRRPSGVRLLEVLPVDVVVSGEVAEVGEERSHLDHVRQVAARGLQAGADVVQRPPALAADVVGDELPRSVVGDLAGRDDEVPAHDDRRVRERGPCETVGLKRAVHVSPHLSSRRRRQRLDDLSSAV
jgi:hypothetical protein